VGRLGPAATLVAIRAAYWLLAAAALIWAPAPERALYGEAYGPASDFLFRTFSQWDARWFLQIAEHGYEEVPQTAAFFPLYPAAAHALAWLTGSTLVAGVLISLAAGAVAAWALAEIARPLLGERGARDSVLYLALFPPAYVLTAFYSDGFFLALAAGSFLAALRGRALTAGVLGGLATGTRLLGLALLPALAYLLWRGRSPSALARLAPLLLLPAAIGLYALYLDHTVGDPWAFTNAQADWDRDASPLGPLAGAWDAFLAAGRGARTLLDFPAAGPGHDERVALWNLSHFAILVGALWLTWVAWRRLGVAFGLYSAATLAIILSVPAEGFPLVSLPRFLLGDFPILLALAAVTLDRPRAREITLCSFAALAAVAAVAFARGVWIA
jgi:Mannosyltransferase (PIG-V)